LDSRHAAWGISRYGKAKVKRTVADIVGASEVMISKLQVEAKGTDLTMRSAVWRMDRLEAWIPSWCRNLDKRRVEREWTVS
jgi:hypothetical protein